MHYILTDFPEKESDQYREDLLNAWLSLSAAVRNERLVETMTFREVFICNILFQEQFKENSPVTATDIANKTGMLKSQINKILVSMEENGLILRKHSEKDKRQIHILLTEEGISRYQYEHKRILRILTYVIDSMGTDTIARFIGELNQAADLMKNLSDPNQANSLC